MTSSMIPNLPPASRPGHCGSNRTVTEYLAVHARQLALEPRLHILRQHRRPLRLGLEQAGRPAVAHHVHRATQMGTWVMSNAGWYEIKLRAPGKWVASIKDPLFAFEGDHDANTGELQRFQSGTKNSLAHFYIIPRADHFSTLAPTTELIAKKIIADTGSKTQYSLHSSATGSTNR